VAQTSSMYLRHIMKTNEHFKGETTMVRMIIGSNVIQVVDHHTGCFLFSIIFELRKGMLVHVVGFKRETLKTIISTLGLKYTLSFPTSETRKNSST